MLTCPQCGSGSTQAGLDRTQCTACGALFDADGKVSPSGPNEATRDMLRDRAERTYDAPVVGNLADLHRLGASAAEGSSKVAGVELPVGATKESAKAGNAAVEADVAAQTGTSEALAEAGNTATEVKPDATAERKGGDDK